MKKKILITGITGFVGSHFADYLSKNEKFKNIWNEEISSIKT